MYIYIYVYIYIYTTIILYVAAPSCAIVDSLQLKSNIIKGTNNDYIAQKICNRWHTMEVNS